MTYIALPPLSTGAAIGHDWIRIPDDMCLPTDRRTIAALIDRVFPEISTRFSDPAYLTQRTIMTPLNTTVELLNEKIMSMLPGEEVRVDSADSVIQDEDAFLVPVEFLNGLNPSGFPPHTLRLKIGAPVMLLRNLDSANGLSNGTRMIVHKITPRLLDVEILGGQHGGKRVWICRIPMVAEPELTGADVPYR